MAKAVSSCLCVNIHTASIRLYQPTRSYEVCPSNIQVKCRVGITIRRNPIISDRIMLITHSLTQSFTHHCHYVLSFRWIKLLSYSFIFDVNYFIEGDNYLRTITFVTCCQCRLLLLLSLLVSLSLAIVTMLKSYSKLAFLHSLQRSLFVGEIETNGFWQL